MLDKMKFWKNDDDLDLDSELPPLDEGEDSSGPGQNTGKKMPEFNPENSLHQVHKSQQANMQNPFQQGSTGDTNKDLELINSKLDTIKAELDSMNQRIKKIERIAEGEKGDESGRRDPWSKF